jgi:sodium-dependent dicarboxylate transporter 2/3/5
MNQNLPAEPPVPKKTGRPVWVNLALAGLALGASGIAYFTLPASMDEAPRRMACIFIAALVLWVTEAIPLFATSLLVIVAEQWLLTTPTNLGIEFSYKDVFAAFGNPVIFLFLGGFVLAKAIEKKGIDVQLASVLMRPFGEKPAGALAGVMFITAVFSMFMSNTATTAMMIVLIQPIARQIPQADRFRRGIILAVPFAANVGGIGTPIGTPPNAIALGALAERGLSISFAQWMAFALPLMVGTLVVMWFFLLMAFRPSSTDVRVKVESRFHLDRDRTIVYLTFFLTVFLWLTSSIKALPWGGISSSVVAMLPAALFTVTRIIDRKDFNSLEWNILVLIAGGIALGIGMEKAELAAWIKEALPLATMTPYAVILVCALVVCALGTVMSHTVAASIVVPLGVSIVVAMAGDPSTMVLAVMVAVASSFAVGLPISTPPNAIAYGSGLVTTRDIMFVGLLTTVAGMIIILSTGPFVIEFFLKLTGAIG